MSVKSYRVRSRQLTLGIGTLAQAIAAAALVLTVLFYTYVGRYTRYLADDHGSALGVRIRGFWNTYVAEYLTHDGHFAATAAQLTAAELPELPPASFRTRLQRVPAGATPPTADAARVEHQRRVLPHHAPVDVVVLGGDHNQVAGAQLCWAQVRSRQPASMVQHQ